ncbi:YceI family protein [soil metagenome]
MKALLTLGLVFGLTSLAVAAEAKYPLTGENTKIEWTGTKKAGKHTGGFSKLTGNATVSGSGEVAMAVDIDVDSLTSDDAKLTAHLKGADFFSVKEHPKAKFASTKIVKGDKSYTVTGDFTLLGKKKEITFPAEINTTGGLKLTAEFKINRTDYGMTYGKGQVDDDVALKVTVTAK